ncbi:fimbria/pilus outer membrane usher protein [Hyphomonas sp. WL0036]|uniref:fimbria/pilus outer membrane usher protein n=1 Tax=Hyphomonas sediminis TaxID=2866160 RepID=UPI001C7F53C8|nr:fimbria/pilus outer membrane usher protein [Hyphomonas sediminis]MBY9066015.1 fimbria/pilus outer membrane usher protein [Hyphomonas sediminis]
MAAEAAPVSGAAPGEALPDTLSLLVEARINGKAIDELVSLQIEPDGCARIETRPLRIAGLYGGSEGAACLQSVAGIDYTLDTQSARLDIFAAQAPAPRRVVFLKQQYAPSLSGVMGSYGLSAQRVYDGEEEIVNAFGDLSLTVHTPAGRLRNDMIATYGDDGGRARRLMTVYEHDLPDRMTRLSVGDSFTRAPRWGRIAAFAGVQYGTDFSMDPQDSWRPYRTFQALLKEQSEIDVRVNGSVRQRTSVSPGYSDFEVSPEAGLNEVEIVIREANGLRRIEDFSFYTSAEALGKGVTDYSVSVGVPRQFSGISSRYEDDLIASGLVRHGVSDAVTAEAYTEIGEAGRVLGAGGQYAAGDLGVVSLSAGVSDSRDGRSGAILSAGIERNTRRSSLQVQARFADSGYSDIVSRFGAEFPDRSIRASTGVYTKAGTFRASYVEEEDKVLADRRFLSFGWEKPFQRDKLWLSLSAYQDFEREETGIAFGLRVSFGPYSAGGGYQSAGGREASSVQLSRARLPGERMQWAVRAADGDAGAVYQGDLAVDLGEADLVVNGGVYGRSNQLIAGVRGGFAAMSGRVALQRQTTGAAAIVRIPDLKGMPIYKDNRIIAVTGEDGVAVIPEVRPYEVNTLSLRPDDVPLDFEVGDFSARFVPKRGISEVSFDVRRQSALAFTVYLPDGRPLPQSAKVELVQSGLVCPVGLEGRVYCPAAEDGDLISVTIPAGRFVQPVRDVRLRGEMRLGAPNGLKMAGID